MEETVKSMSRVSVRLLNIYGFTKMVNEDLEGGISLFQEVLNRNQDYSPALDNIA
jgi:hypothetical protein